MLFIITATAAIIGIETIVAKLMGARWRALIIVPAANIMSLIVGLYISGVLFYAIEPMFGTHLVDTAAPAAWTTLATLAFLGVLIEWPLLRLCFKSERPWKRSLIALLVAAGLSNALLVVLAYNTYDHGLALAFKRTTPEQIAAELEGPLPWVYYIDRDGESVMRIRFDGSLNETVCAIPFRQPSLPYWAYPGLDLRASEQDGRVNLIVYYADYVEAWDLLDHSTVLEHPDPMAVPVDFDIAKASKWKDDDSYSMPRLNGIADFRPESERDEEIKIWFGGSARYGQHSLKVFNPMVGHDLEASALTALPGGLAVFDFARYSTSDSPQGIMLISTKTMRRALLVEDGWCPVVVYEQPD